MYHYVIRCSRSSVVEHQSYELAVAGSSPAVSIPYEVIPKGIIFYALM